MKGNTFLCKLHEHVGLMPKAHLLYVIWGNRLSIVANSMYGQVYCLGSQKAVSAYSPFDFSSAAYLQFYDILQYSPIILSPELIITWGNQSNEDTVVRNTLCIESTYREWKFNDAKTICLFEFLFIYVFHYLFLIYSALYHFIFNYWCWQILCFCYYSNSGCLTLLGIQFRS